MLIAVANQKGGAGKSTIAINLALFFEKKKKLKVLFVDGDRQRTASSFFLSDGIKSSIEIIQSTDEHLAKLAKQHAPKYDITIIDCQGAIAAATKAAMIAADYVIVPLSPSEPDVLSTSQFVSEVVDDALLLNGSLRGAFLFNKDDRTIYSKEIKKIASEMDFPCFETSIPQATAFREAFTKRKAIFEYEPKGKATHSFLNFCKELTKEINLNG